MTPPKPPPLVIGGRYQLQHAVGRGGYGVVYRALDQQTGGAVAVKMLSPGASCDPQLVGRMVREQQAMAALAGTNAVAALDLCRGESGALFLVMEWLEGVDLEQRLAGLKQQGNSLETGELLEILRPVVETLEKAREIGIVHRDLKPANIFLMAPPRADVRVLDFGLARIKSSATLTSLGTVMGSPGYIAPETWRGNSKLVDHRADLYSLGVIVFRALSGQLPFDAQSLAEMLRLVTTAPRPSLRNLRADLPPGVDAWTERALAILPEQRFQSAPELYQSLQAVLSGQTMPRLDEHRPQAVCPTPSDESVIAAAWSRAASVLKRFAGQLRWPVELRDKEPAVAQPLEPALADARPPVSPIQASLPHIPWPQSPQQTGKTGRASPEPEAPEHRPSLVSEMLAATDLHPRPGTGPDSEDELGTWMGGSQPRTAAEPQGASPTLIRFRERLSSALEQAEANEELPASEGQLPVEEHERGPAPVDFAGSAADDVGGHADTAAPSDRGERPTQPEEQRGDVDAAAFESALSSSVESERPARVRKRTGRGKQQKPKQPKTSDDGQERRKQRATRKSATAKKGSRGAKRASTDRDRAAATSPSSTRKRRGGRRTSPKSRKRAKKRSDASS